MSTTNFGVSALQRLNTSVSRFRVLESNIMRNLRVCLPAIVQSFDPAAQTVEVLITTNEYVWFNAPPFGTVKQPPLSLQTAAPRTSILTMVPICISNGGGVNLTFPIHAGDECEVLFMDTPFCVWWKNGKLDNNPIDQRWHSLSDGIAIFGVRSSPRKLANYSTDSAQLRTDDGNTLVDIKDGQITVKATDVLINGTIKINGGSGIPAAGWGIPTGGVLIPSFDAPAAILSECAAMIAEIVTVLKALGIFTT